MAVRLVGAFAVLAIAGVAAGYGVSSLDTSAPLTISVAAPVPGESPSYPVNEYDVEPDPADPALTPGLPMTPTRLRANGRTIVLSTPTGWFQGGDRGNWIFSVLTNSRNTYQLRVGLFADQQAPQVKVAARIDALRAAEADEEMDHVVIEDQSDTSLVATYLQGGYRRVTMERFLTLDGTSARATVAVIGRETDRAGMADLLDRVSASLRLP